MAAITDLNELLKTISPKVKADDYVFCTVTGAIKDYLTLEPIAFFHEDEGVTLVLKRQDACNAGLPFDGIFKLITLTVHSSLEAVGLTAAVASKLASYDISANVIAAYYHDHIFVQKEKVDIAMSALAEFSGES
ncbi:ACT domain-containing protein [Photobacterium swingsii]|uniref:ACT domain-containing protein n=1 Tax=Photobacterium swingsii TaxID=680026 RepID=UPI004068C5E1